MEWFVEEPRRGQIALTLIVLVAVAVGIWLGRKKPRVTIPVTLVFLVLAAVVIPSAIPARPAAQRNACIANLRALQDAKYSWARAKNKQATDVPSEDDLYGTNEGSAFLRGRL